MKPADYTQRNEGCRLVGYLDSRGIPTIGYGCTGPNIKVGTVWTQNQANQEFYSRYAAATMDAAMDLGAMCWERLDTMRRAVLADMSYQMGAHGLAEFVTMLNDLRADLTPAVQAQHWDGAAEALMKSAYAKQTPARAKRNHDMLLTGQWPQEPW